MIVAKEVAPVDIVSYWHRIEHLVKEAMLTTKGKYRSHHIFMHLLKATMQLWLAVDTEAKIHAVAITEIVNYPAGARVCRCICVTGEGREEWQHLMADVEKMAKRNGCTDISLQARWGWTRIMKQQGYELTHAQLDKSLKE